MSGRQSMAVFNAVQAVVWGMAQTITQAAKTHGCAVSSVRRALRAAGVEPRKGGRQKTEKKEHTFKTVGDPMPVGARFRIAGVQELADGSLATNCKPGHETIFVHTGRRKP